MTALSLSPDADHGVPAATWWFSPVAQQNCLLRGAVPIILVDGDRIANEMMRHGAGLNRRPLEELAVDDDFFAAGEDLGRGV